jgi:hypothetical protein
VAVVTTLARDQAQMWLSDHCGQSLNVALTVDRGDYAAHVLQTEDGILRHWRHGGDGFLVPGAVLTGDPEMDRRLNFREDIAGLYRLEFGGTAIMIDITDLPDSVVAFTPGMAIDAISFDLDENVTLTLTHPTMTLDAPND